MSTRMHPLGTRQLERLLGLASPSMMLVVGDALSASLVGRGLLAPHFPDQADAWHRITPAGMRALADAYEAGLLDRFMGAFPPVAPHEDKQRNNNELLAGHNL
jgi:hypothetical protein